MELFIEKEFLENFYREVNIENPSNEEDILINMLSDYGDKTVYIDYKVTTHDELEKLKEDNPYFALIFNTSYPIEIDSFEEHFKNKNIYSRSIVLMNKEQVWFDELRQKGVLCFSFENYKSELKKLLSILNIKIDLSVGFSGWDCLKKLNEVPSDKIIITDNYIIIDKDKQKIEDNLAPLLKKIIPTQHKEIQLDIFTKEFNEKPKGDFLKVKEKAKKAYNKIKNGLEGFINVKHTIYSLEHARDFDFHGRGIITNYYYLNTGKGFNLMPSKKSNEEIRCDSIFDKYGYDRIKNLEKGIEDYKKKLDKIETRFKYFTEHL